MAIHGATQRLYFDDAYTHEFDARVLETRIFNEHPAIVLDATAFYPEGGGQPADHGTLHDRTVIDVQEQDDCIFHLLDAPLNVAIGTVVHGTLDWARRYDFMQQHTGQHTLSGAWYRLFGANTASWHLSADTVTIDIDRANITDEDIVLVEQLANEVIWSDVPVTAQLVNHAELSRLTMRKGATRDGIVRIVAVGDFDRIGCGGTHVAASGQCGAISIRSVETRGHNSRIEFACGARALHDHRVKTQILRDVSQALSVKKEDILSATHHLKQNVDELRRDNASMHHRLIEYETRNLVQAADLRWHAIPLVVCRFEERDAAELKQLAQGIVDAGGIALLAGTYANKALLQFACSPSLHIELQRILQQVLPNIEGKGGGQRFLAQGAGQKISAIDTALADATYAVLQLRQA